MKKHYTLDGGKPKPAQLTQEQIQKADLRDQNRKLRDIMDKMITVFQDKAYDELTREEKDVANQMMLLDLVYVEEGRITRKKQR